MAYANIDDLQHRTTQTLTDTECEMCIALLEDAAAILDASAPSASDDIKKIVSCRMVLRSIGDSQGYPIGASQGSMSGLGYSQSWTVGSGGTVGELYLSKTDKKMLGISNKLGAYSPLEDMTCAG